MILNKKQIKERLLHYMPPMVTNLKDMNIQLQPTSLDLTVKNIYTWASSGCLDFDNSKRKLSEKDLIKPDEMGRYYLPAENYQIEVNELFNMPLDVVGKTISRSSLQRCGAAILEGYFDPGFKGIGVSLLEVFNPYGLIVYRDARICQIVFELTEPTESYNGTYQEGKE